MLVDGFRKSRLIVISRGRLGRTLTVIRLPDGIRFRVAEAVAQSVAAGGPIRSMNSWFIDAMIWWINNQNETYALFSACVDLDLRKL